ncbi:hypothetical protein BD779DRAFT_1507344 [Infundibulicybe gibba]|nr:hypothetical protein BD779DRAFT_1507344 [Infundibulicybe gibba]
MGWYKPQMFNWVMSDICQGCDSTAPHFNPSSSASFETTGERTTNYYTTGEASG